MYRNAHATTPTLSIPPCSATLRTEKRQHERQQQRGPFSPLIGVLVCRWRGANKRMYLRT